MTMNANNEAGRCICSFNYGVYRIHVFEVPDENVGCISGWIFCFNTHPIFYSIAIGSECFNRAFADSYAKHLVKDGIANGEDPYEIAGVECKLHGACRQADPLEEDWTLNSDEFLSFTDAVNVAMIDAGYVQRPGERWELRVSEDYVDRLEKALSVISSHYGIDAVEWAEEQEDE